MGCADDIDHQCAKKAKSHVYTCPYGTSGGIGHAFCSWDFAYGTHNDNSAVRYDREWLNVGWTGGSREYRCGASKDIPGQWGMDEDHKGHVRCYAPCAPGLLIKCHHPGSGNELHCPLGTSSPITGEKCVDVHADDARTLTYRHMPGAVFTCGEGHAFGTWHVQDVDGHMRVTCRPHHPHHRKEMIYVAVAVVAVGAVLLVLLTSRGRAAP